METSSKTMLAAGGILAVALTIGSQIDGTKAPVPEPVSVQIARAERGAEIRALREPNREVFKADSVWVHPKDAKGATVKADSFKVASFTARVYARPKYYRDADGDSLRALDTTVRDISPLAKLNPLKTHDRYVDAGPYTARWMADAPGDYRMDSGAASVKYRALFKATVKAEATESGMKETVTLADEKAPHTLRWVVESDGSLVANALGGFDVRAKDGTVPMRIERPIAWDAENKPVMASATVEGDTMTFRVTVLPGQRYPVAVDPTTSVSPTSNDAAVYSADNATYATARNADPWTYIKSAAQDSSAIIGQYYGNGLYSLYGRYLLGFYINGDNIATVTACSLYVYIASDYSTTNFTVNAILSKQKGVPAVNWQKEIYGWASSGVYDMAAYEFGGFNTGNITSVPMWMAMPFTGRIDSLYAAIARNDTIRMALISYNDISNTAPTNSEAITVKTSRAGVSVRPYLSYTYTVAVPTGFTATGASTTSVKLSWTDNIAGETGYRIYDLDAAAYVDSTAANDSTKTITGLTANTKKRYRVDVKGGTADGQQSNVDSTYTWANVPTAPNVTFPADSLAVVKIDTTGTGNPSYTEYAIQDSVTGKYFDGRFNRFFSTTAAESILWRTYAAWGGTAGDTVAVGVGRKYNIRAKARSGK